MRTNKLKSALFIAVLLQMIACEETVEDSSIKSYALPFPTLPTANKSVTVTGTVKWWFWEGDGGCFGTLSAGGNDIELYSEADLCAPIEYEEGDVATMDIVFLKENQYHPEGKAMYTVAKFR
jgi:hypothetical protein